MDLLLYIGGVFAKTSYKRNVDIASNENKINASANWIVTL